MISKQKVLSLCHDKVTTYKSLKRNGYYCPALKSSLMTMKFMRGVIFKTDYWLPEREKISIY